MEIMGLVQNVEKIRIGTWVFYLYSVGLAVASILQNLSKYRERERGKWAVYYTNPQSFTVTFSYSLA